jgi:HAD superfamily phosphoserine phosphatase-like hydrolase
MRLAVIDLDGTLLKGMTAERVFFLHLIAHGRIGFGRATAFLLSFAGDLLRGGLQRAIGTNARFLRGETPETARRWAREFGRAFLRKAVPDRLREKVLSLKTDGCRVVLLSGSLQILVDELKERLGAEVLIGGELETADGKLTGRKTGIHPYGREKVAALFSRIDPGPSTGSAPGPWPTGSRTFPSSSLSATPSPSTRTAGCVAWPGKGAGRRSADGRVRRRSSVRRRSWRRSCGLRCR